MLTWECCWGLQCCVGLPKSDTYWDPCCCQCDCIFFLSLFYMWATSWQNQQNDCAPSEDSVQPGHPPSLIRVLAVLQWVAKDLSFLHADSEDTDQTGQMLRLIWVFAEWHVSLLVLSCGGLCSLRINICTAVFLCPFYPFGASPQFLINLF